MRAGHAFDYITVGARVHDWPPSVTAAEQVGDLSELWTETEVFKHEGE